jgi:hypothetical protein
MANCKCAGRVGEGERLARETAGQGEVDDEALAGGGVADTRREVAVPAAGDADVLVDGEVAPGRRGGELVVERLLQRGREAERRAGAGRQQRQCLTELADTAEALRPGR